MERRRWVMVAIATSLVVTTAVLLVSRDSDRSDGDVATSDTTELDRTTTSKPTTTTTAPPTTPSSAGAAPTTTGDPGPPFQASIEPVTAEQLGSSWKPDLGCAAPEQLRAVNVSYWGYDGAVHAGRLIVDSAQAEATVAIFRDIYVARFPIERIVPIDAYGGDDQVSMRDNNTSGFNCRTVAGSTKLSQHAYGRAIDVNPLVNPYVTGSTVDPPEGAPYADRSRNDPGMIHANDAVVQAFKRQGWGWGGSWGGGKDYQHFSTTGG